MRNFVEGLEIFNPSTKLSAAFTAAATDIITSSAHGFQEGDLIHVASTTTLPAGLSATTNYFVRDITTNTFKVSASLLGPVVDITTTGTGTHTFLLKGKTIMVSDWRHLVLSINTASSAALVMKFQGSLQEAMPDFNAAQSTSNNWDYVEVKDLQDASAIDGDTGITLVGTDDNRQLEFNVNGLKWVTVSVGTWTAGVLSAKLNVYND